MEGKGQRGRQREESLERTEETKKKGKGWRKGRENAGRGAKRRRG